MPRLLLVDEVTARRLRVAAALTGAFDVITASDGEDPLRVARSSRPDLVLVAVHRAHPEASLRLCRTLRTDVRPVRRVAVYDARARPAEAEAVMGPWLADGYLTGSRFDEILAFAEAVWRGERPVRNVGPAPSALARLAGRLFRGET